LPLKADATNEDRIDDIVRRTAGRYGRPDMLMVNAAVTLSGDIEHFETATRYRVIDVNLVG
jgi:NAD(P)-dependent dehydrogenase (short-subunit alcohol dehydrogenase family)